MSKEPPEGQRTGAAGEEPRLRRAMNQQRFEIKRVTTAILAVEHPFSTGFYFLPCQACGGAARAEHGRRT